MTTNQPMTATKFTENAIRLSDIVRILRKYGVYLLGLMILGGTLATIWGRFQMPQYDAVAMVHMDQHSSISLGSGGGARATNMASKCRLRLSAFRVPSSRS